MGRNRQDRLTQALDSLRIELPSRSIRLHLCKELRRSFKFRI
jgi:hypothetical protein